jgi:MoaA/NifB/PqqE/SkfB family radical SAM enzyme
MLSIFVEASCNRYNRDECVDCHVYEPLGNLPKSEWHLPIEDARIMAKNIQKVDSLNALAQQEINMTGGEASQNPDIVEIFKVFRTVTPNVCLHTNLDINSDQSKRWLRLVEIMQLGGRIDITLYPVSWEKFQKPLLKKVLRLQKYLLVNVVFENLPDLSRQLGLLLDFFIEEGETHAHVGDLLKEYQNKVQNLIKTNPDCNEDIYLKHMGNTGAFARKKEFTFGINLLPAFRVDALGRRMMTSTPFPKDNYLIECPAARGSIDIMTVRQNGDMTPCCDVGNLQCQPRFGNLLQDSPEKILEKFTASSKIMATGIIKNRDNIQNAKSGEWVEEGIPPYCS